MLVLFFFDIHCLNKDFDNGPRWSQNVSISQCNCPVSFKRILLTVFLLLFVCATYCTEPDACNDDGVFLGIARDRQDIINKRAVNLQTMQPTNCDAGVRCRKFCSEDSIEWNFFRNEKSKFLHFITCYLGVGDD